MLLLEADADRLALGAAVASAEALGAVEFAVAALLAEGATVALGIGVLRATVLARGADDITGGEVTLGTALGGFVAAIDGTCATEDSAGGDELAAWLAEAITPEVTCPSSAAGAQLQMPIPANIERAAAVYL